MLTSEQDSAHAHSEVSDAIDQESSFVMFHLVFLLDISGHLLLITLSNPFHGMGPLHGQDGDPVDQRRINMNATLNP